MQDNLTGIILHKCLLFQHCFFQVTLAKLYVSLNQTFLFFFGMLIQLCTQHMLQLEVINLLDRPFTVICDIFSTGVVLFILLSECMFGWLSVSIFWGRPPEFRSFAKFFGIFYFGDWSFFFGFWLDPPLEQPSAKQAVKKCGSWFLLTGQKDFQFSAEFEGLPEMKFSTQIQNVFLRNTASMIIFEQKKNGSKKF